MRSKKNCFEVKGNAGVVVIWVSCFLLVIIISAVLDFVGHSFTPDWVSYKFGLGLWAITSFPFLFVKSKVKVEGNKMTVVKICGLRRTFMLDKVTKVLISKPDDPSKTNIVAHIDVYFGRRKFAIDSSLENYDKFYDYIMENVEPDKIDMSVWKAEEETDEDH